MAEILNQPLFGILISIIAYIVGVAVYKRFKKTFLNPLLIANILIILFLIVFKVPIEYYNKGGEYILFFLGPATVILAVPLYKRLLLLKENLLPILIGVLVGSLTSVSSVVILGKILNVDSITLKSLIPKSVTTPIGMEISNNIGGVESITIIVIILTGIFGAVFGTSILNLFKVKHPIAKGLALGLNSHAIGTAKALELGETEGAMGSLAIGLTGVMTVFIASIFSVFI